MSQSQGSAPGWQPVGAFAPHETEPRKRPSAGGILRWSATGALCIGAIILFGVTGAISANHEADLLERGAGVAAAQQRIKSAAIGVEDLPDAAAAKRWLSAANKATRSVAEVQNKFLVNSGPLSLEGIPTSVKERIGGVRVYTHEERTELAEAARATALEGLDRSLLTVFGVPDTDADGMNAASSWANEISDLKQDEAISTFRWSSPEVVWFDREGQSEVLWQLRTVEGELLAWATATFDTTSLVLSDLVLNAAETNGAVR